MVNQTHDYSHPRWGRNVGISAVHDSGAALSACGWGHGVEQGDYLILPNGSGTTRYLVWAVDYYTDPSDMWSATLVFSPRQSGGEV